MPLILFYEFNIFMTKLNYDFIILNLKTIINYIII